MIFWDLTKKHGDLTTKMVIYGSITADQLAILGLYWEYETNQLHMVLVCPKIWPTRELQCLSKK